MDMLEAELFVQRINENKDPNIRYKQSRPITDIKQMLQSSAELYCENTAFWVKKQRGGGYESITYQQTLLDVNALGTALLQRGLKGKRIAVIGDNSYQWSIAYLAVVGGVGTVVPLDKELHPSEFLQLVVNAEVSCVLFDKKFEKIFRNMRASGETVLKLLVNLEGDADLQSKRNQDDQGAIYAERTAAMQPGALPHTHSIVSFTELLQEGFDLLGQGDRSFLDAEIDRKTMNILIFTSGTTGVSKGVMLSHQNITEDLMSAPTVLEIKSTDIFFSVLPIHHTYECTCGFLLALYKGAAIAHCEGLKYITKNLEEISPTIFLGVPALFENLYRKIWQNVKKQGKEKLLRRVICINKGTKRFGLDLGNLFLKEIRAVFGGRMRIMICGGAAINPDILEGFKDLGIMALQGYGLTECAPLAALNPDKAAKSASIGKAIPNFDMKIEGMNEEGIGEICLKGGNVMLGYYNMPEATSEVIKNGWFYTGDLGYIDQDGYAYLTGRKKNVIITKNGKNVYPEELEYYLSKIPYVLESLVYDRESEDGQDAVIVASIRLDEEEVTEHLGKGYTEKTALELLWQEVDKINETAPPFKKIKHIVMRKEEFEKNTSKKIKRFAISNKQ